MLRRCQRAEADRASWLSSGGKAVENYVEGTKVTGMRVQGSGE